ncbi:phenylacetic acid degradation operon negative regulatory protein PaaX [Scopulibacillus cellulosilyticus]|uniref:Phenylacetic acid degradation operon negative regulatory protein PaaX n=1 Tax=Scopulibacillus cellulosilyticus TaxID=2665665 RepID=A0ABW2PT06_9BACL
MRNSLNTRSMIFTLYGDYIRHYDSEIWIGSLIRLLEPFGHNEQSVRAAISRMNKQGWITNRREKNKSFYSLTERGIKRMDEAANRIFKLTPSSWDGRWRMFMYTIPEEKRNIRDELRRELVWSGFGMLSNSCWITPNDLEKQVDEIVQKYDISPYVNLFLAENKGPQSNHKLVYDSWDIDDINKRYDQFIKYYSEKYVVDKSKIEKGVMSDKECFVERTKLVHEYRKFLFVDPGLPQELLPEKWLGEYAASLFGDYYRALAKPANQFFEQVFFDDNDNAQKSEAYNVLDHPLIID